MLKDAGSISHEDAVDWAGEQYDAFAERRRIEAETQAQARYIEDLRESAMDIDQRRIKHSKKKKEDDGKSDQSGNK